MHADDKPAHMTGIEIAIVGMAGRFPGAADVDAFWRNIRDGVESVTRFTDEQLRARGVPPELLNDPAYVKAGVLFEGFEQFDAGFFGYTPREAEHLDPQQRIFLECAWEALEHAGCHAHTWPGSIGVYAGDGPNLYLMRHLLPSFGVEAGSNIADLLGLMSGNSAGSLCTRVAYKLNLRGPAVTVQTECSTSLVAVHTACHALLGHDCDMALAGGVWLNLLQEGGYRHQAGSILSPDGHCRAFDAKAGGTVIGSGVGIVVLKRLADALRDGDTIHAVIKGSAANNDGSDKVGFTAPSVTGQADVIRAAQAIADVPAHTVGYVEAHGTGTTLGDPIEMAALTQAFRAGTDQRGFCAVGSVKTNVGHLDAAAGVAGLIKATMALKHATLPPSLHFEQPNPQIDFASSPFYVNSQSRPWPRHETPRRAGVSSFGIGGTNVHLVLEEAPTVVPSMGTADATGWQVLPLSALSDAAARQACERLATHLQAPAGQALADVAYTLQTGRRAFAHRRAAVANETSMAIEMLSSPDHVLARSAPTPDQPPELVFLFPGGGTQHTHMGAAFYRSDTLFRDDVDRCCELLRPEMGLDLRELLFPAPGHEVAAGEQLVRIGNAQPALFVIEYAMAQWWMRRGVRPAVMMGHSLGEYVAACLAGVFRLEDALRVVAARGRLLQSLPPGAMTAVAMAPPELETLLQTGCDLAAVNGEQLCVLSGPLQSIEAAERELFGRGHLPRRLHVSIASHSAMTEPVLAELEAVIASVPRQAPRIPFVSNVTGRLITAEQAVSPRYWAQHLRGTVRFADGLNEVFQTPGRMLLEVGPGETLTGLARQHPRAASAAGVLASQAHVQQHARNAQQTAHALAGLWLAGVEIDWAACHAGQTRRRVPLPAYPFQRRRYWVDRPDARVAAKPVPTQALDMFYAPSWKRAETPLPVPPSEAAEGCLVVLGHVGSLAGSLLRHLGAQGRPVVWAECGQGYARPARGHWVVRPGERADHERLLREAAADFGRVAGVYHLWSLDEEPSLGHTQAQLLERSFFSLLALVQALDATSGAHPLAITVVANQLQDVAGIEPLCPEKATLLGISKVIGQEHPQLSCRVIDVVLPAPESEAEKRLVRQIVAEAQAGEAGESPVAYRGPHRWVRSYEPMTSAVPAQLRLRRQGVYLITGGLGAVGQVLAKHLAHAWQARLVLLGRTPCPERGSWERLLDAGDQPESLKQLLRQLKALEAAGAEVLTVSADVTDPQQLHAAMEQVHQRFGGVNGVIHAAVGHAASGMIAHKTRAMVDAAFAPKIRGTAVLLDALRNEPLDFVLLCSSLASLVGGLGKSDYAAANAYQDALAPAARRGCAYPVFSVNWDAWRDIGVAAEMSLPGALGLGAAQGALAFERIVNGPDIAQVVVSTTDLAMRFGPLDNGMFEVLDADPPAAPRRSSHPRPLIAGSYVAPEGELESGLAALWTEALGIAPIGVHDNLFELGGDSLLAIQLLGRVRKAYGVELHPAAFFKAPTVSELTLLVEDRLIADLESAAPEAGRVDATV